MHATSSSTKYLPQLHHVATLLHHALSHHYIVGNHHYTSKRTNTSFQKEPILASRPRTSFLARGLLVLARLVVCLLVVSNVVVYLVETPLCSVLHLLAVLVEEIVDAIPRQHDPPTDVTQAIVDTVLFII